MPLFASYRDFIRLETKVDEALRLLHSTNERLRQMANSIDDLNAAVTDLTTAVSDYTAAVAAEIAAIQAANNAGANDAAIEAAVANVKALTDTLKADTAAAQPAPAP